MTLQVPQQQNARSSDMQPSDCKFQNKFFYQIANMKAMKIVVLIKISKLNYSLQQMVENTHNFYLKTQKGQLYKEYEIINYIINESKQNQRSDMNSKNYQNLKDSSISHDSEIESQHQNNPNQEQNQIINLCGQDNYVHSKMMQVLFDLRSNLFPLLEEFYKYLLGHEKVKKIKYQSLINKIKSQIAKLDSHMNDHSDVYAYQNSFLNIIIACELFIGCKFVFEEKFRKFKYMLFNKYQKISKKPEFQEIFGKTTLCMKEYVPPEFDSEDQKQSSQQANSKKNDQIIPQDIYRLTEYVIGPSSNEPQRNQLLYNYFRSVFTQNQHKRNYFHYYWLMFDTLKCDLIQIIYENPKDKSLQQLTPKLNMLQFQLQKYLKKSSIDYGVIGIYQTQNNSGYLMRGVLCLGSKSFDNLQSDIESSVELREWKIRKIDINQQNQRRDVENIWQNTIENNHYDSFVTYSILYI